MTRRRAEIEAHSEYDDERHEPAREGVEELIVIDGAPEQIADALFRKEALKRSGASSKPEDGAGFAGSPARRRRLLCMRRAALHLQADSAACCDDSRVKRSLSSLRAAPFLR